MSSEFRLGRWVVQPDQNAISCNGKNTRLEPKMVEVLVCLAEHAGETVSKDQLHQRVWGEHVRHRRRTHPLHFRVASGSGR